MNLWKGRDAADIAAKAAKLASKEATGVHVVKGLGRQINRGSQTLVQALSEGGQVGRGFQKLAEGAGDDAARLVKSVIVKGTDKVDDAAANVGKVVANQVDDVAAAGAKNVNAAVNSGSNPIAAAIAAADVQPSTTTVLVDKIGDTVADAAGEMVYKKFMTKVGPKGLAVGGLAAGGGIVAGVAIDDDEDTYYINNGLPAGSNNYNTAAGVYRQGEDPAFEARPNSGAAVNGGAIQRPTTAVAAAIPPLDNDTRQAMLAYIRAGGFSGAQKKEIRHALASPDAAFSYEDRMLFINELQK